jgi:hypothetical protein
VKKRVMQADQLDLILDWTIDVVPMLGVAVFTFRTDLMDISGKKHPPRELGPIAIPLRAVKALSESLPGLISTMESMGISDTNGPPGAPGKH